MFSTGQKLARNQWLVCLALLAAMVTLHAWSLLRFPAPFVDEAWLASRAGAFVQTGRAFGPLDAGIADHFEGYWTYNQWFMTVADSLSVRLYGAPDLLPVRVVSLIFGLILLGAVYTIANRLGGRQLGWLSAFLTSLSMPFLYSAHLARYDVVSAAFGFWAIALYLTHRNSFWPGLLSGACVGLAFETHAYSLIYAPVILALYFWDYGWVMFRRRQLWGFVVGGLLGLFFYAALHVLPYPRTFLAISQLAYAGTRTPPILTFDPRVILDVAMATGRLLFAVYQLQSVVLLWAVAALLKRRTRSDQTLLVLVAALVLTHTLVVRNKFAFYAILMTPALDILLAAFLLDFIQRPWRGRLSDYVNRILVWGLTLGAIAITWSSVRMDLYQAYEATQSRINQAVRPGESVMGAQVYWFGLQDHRYLSWELLLAYQNYAPGATLEDAFREYRPDIFVIDGHLSNFVADLDPQSEMYRQHIKIPRAELESFLNRHAELATAFENSYYREVHVYRIQW